MTFALYSTQCEVTKFNRFIIIGFSSCVVHKSYGFITECCVMLIKMNELLSVRPSCTNVLKALIEKVVNFRMTCINKEFSIYHSLNFWEEFLHSLLRRFLHFSVAHRFYLSIRLCPSTVGWSPPHDISIHFCF